MWFADVVLDLSWFSASQGKLGQPRARAPMGVFETDLKAEILLYGDDEAIRHLRVLIHVDDQTTAEVCVDRNIQQWVSALEVSSAMATPTFTTAAHVQRNSAAFMVCLGQGDETTDALQITPHYAPPAKADFESAAKLMVSWRPDFKTHLHYLSRFLNHNLPPEVRWHNGYRLLEWHFRRGKTGLAGDKVYRAFLREHGSGLDAYLSANQTRYGLLEETRALVAHAMLAKTADKSTANSATVDLVLKTFTVLELLVSLVMTEGAIGVQFKPKPPAGPPATTSDFTFCSQP